jgi:hypothetical protein
MEFCYLISMKYKLFYTYNMCLRRRSEAVDPHLLTKSGNTQAKLIKLRGVTTQKT